MESADSAPVRKAALNVLTAPGVLLVASWVVVVMLILVVFRLAAAVI